MSDIERDRQVALMTSRARAVWSTTTPEQRTACYFSGVGRDAGVFLYDNIEDLAAILAGLHAAIVARDADAIAALATRFADRVFQESFFAPHSFPNNWQSILDRWVRGVPFAEILKGLGARDSLKAQTFVQDSVAYKLVWAAEAVRSYAVAADPAVSESLGDGPALAFTYGVPSIQAALLCQSGFSSRVGAMHACTQLDTTFTSLNSLEEWLIENAEILSRRDFWQSDDQYLLWTRRSTGGSLRVRPWRDQQVEFQPYWLSNPPDAGTKVRVIPEADGQVRVCHLDLTPLGGAPLEVHGAILEAVVGDMGEVRVSVFGP